ncbi:MULTISPECIES: bifunctional hydroxymethylpyrimidine kinase/phosphomethylpyrimidine kinase [Cobetia]|uniref:bifunctional hydroxymethylpyrimidine kinase/phosphomethylpyrimidine kinase n=1 Tax=Cobetia TaxID=204286 RepID=UPI0004ACC180|nr:MULTISPECIES: hydroxymethylpyrimidine/phosphomethylpyrimidine kinase [Cobetia]
MPSLESEKTPCYVLVLAGHDPSGGAGLIADSEAIRTGGGWALTVPTALTVQNSCNVRAVMPQSGESILGMARALIDDFRPQALKIGLLASHESLVAAVALIDELRARWPMLPVVWDPVLKAGGGCELSSESLIELARETLMSRVDVVTPNRVELVRLSGLTAGTSTDASTDRADDRADAQVERLLAMGVGAVLVTGTDPLASEQQASAAQATDILHYLYRRNLPILSLDCPRLPGSYHGSGCTLASHLAVRLAQGMSLEPAWHEAQQATWQSLAAGHDRQLRGSLMNAQYLPWR